VSFPTSTLFFFQRSLANKLQTKIFIYTSTTYVVFASSPLYVEAVLMQLKTHIHTHTKHRIF